MQRNAFAKHYRNLFVKQCRRDIVVLIFDNICDQEVDSFNLIVTKSLVKSCSVVKGILTTLLNFIFVDDRELNVEILGILVVQKAV